MESQDVYTHIATNTTTQVASGNVCLVRIVVNSTANGAVTIYDEIGAGNTAVVAILKASIAEHDYEYGVNLATGLKVVTAAASDLTVVWRKV